jgi:hypothetical protein
LERPPTIVPEHVNAVPATVQRLAIESRLAELSTFLERLRLRMIGNPHSGGTSCVRVSVNRRLNLLDRGSIRQRGTNPVQFGHDQALPRLQIVQLLGRLIVIDSIVGNQLENAIPASFDLGQVVGVLF